MKNWISRTTTILMALTSLSMIGPSAFAQSDMNQTKNQTQMSEVKIQDLRKQLSENLIKAESRECNFHVGFLAKPTSLQKLSQDIRNATCDKLQIFMQKIDRILSNETVLAHDELNSKGLLAQKIVKDVMLASLNHTIEVSRIALRMIDEVAQNSDLSSSERDELEEAKANFQLLERQSAEALSSADAFVQSLKNMKVTM